MGLFSGGLSQTLTDSEDVMSPKTWRTFPDLKVLCVSKTGESGGLGWGHLVTPGWTEA